MTDFEKKLLSELKSFLKQITTNQDLIYKKLNDITKCLAKISANTKIENKNRKPRIKSEIQRQTLQTIFEMRDKSCTFESIARHLEREKISTFSGRGKWHAQTIHRLYNYYKEKILN